MNNTIFDNINRLVREKDELYILGDCLLPFDKQHWKKSFQWMKDQINCKNISLIVGNHDPKLKNGLPKKELDYFFDQVAISLMLKDHETNTEMWLSHYAHRVWPKSHFNSIHLYAHSHYTLPDNPNTLSLDIGIDAVAGRKTGYTYEELENNNLFYLLKPENYKPITFKEITDLLLHKKRKTSNKSFLKKLFSFKKKFKGNQ